MYHLFSFLNKNNWGSILVKMADHEDEFHDVVDDGEKDEEILPPEPKEGELYCLPSM